MVPPDAETNHGVETQSPSSPPPPVEERGRDASNSQRLAELSIPKNRSTGNLLAMPMGGTDRARIRFSFDAGAAAAEFDAMSRSPIMTDHDHGFGTSGLRRIRQQPASRAPTLPSSASSSRGASIPRSSSMVLNLPSTSRKSSGALSAGPTSPVINFTEDLSRFPSESLHSFSFTNQSEEFIHNRQNVLKRSIEFMKDRMGWAATNTGIASAQARISGDQELQSMLELLTRAKLMDEDAHGHGLALLQGPVTGPAEVDGENIFEKSFRTDSPEPYESPPSPQTKKKLGVSWNETPARAEYTQDDSSEDELPEMTQDRGSGESSRTTTDESRIAALRASPPPTRRQSLKRTYTDTAPLSIQNKLMDAMAQPYIATDMPPPELSLPHEPSSEGRSHTVNAPFPMMGPAVHGHASRWAPAAQAIFTTEARSPWTILAANDLACLVFGVTKAEVRKMGIMEVVQQERRAWLEEKLSQPGPDDVRLRSPNTPLSQQPSPTATSSFLGRSGGVTAALLSKPSSWQMKNQRKAQTDDGVGSAIAAAKKAKGLLNHHANKSRGVLLCGDVVPIQKRNGSTGSASLWVKEKRGGLIWVLEEIHEDVAYISFDDDGCVTKSSGATGSIWGEGSEQVGKDIGVLIPRIPRQGIDPRTGSVDYAEVAKFKYFTCRNSGRVNIPATVERVSSGTDLRISSFPHIAGIMVVSPRSLTITSSNSVFSAALFGQESPDGKHITSLIPNFDRILRILTEEDGLHLVDGMVVPEHSFRRARAFLALRDGKADAASYFLRPEGLPAKHRDGTELKIDVQMRVVKSDKTAPYEENVIEEGDEESADGAIDTPTSELVYALWITYSRHLHASSHNLGAASPLLTGPPTPLHQPSPGQTTTVPTPVDMDSDEPKIEPSHASVLTRQLKAATKKAAEKLIGRDKTEPKEEKTEKEEPKPAPPIIIEPPTKKTINDFVILEDMGQGAYGQVKLARLKKSSNKVVLKYVTKRRILVDTWTRDRRLGTVPLEIHVMDYLSRDDLKHPNIVEMTDFFEDDVNYYIEMLPHGLPGMDLFDYIELRVNMEERECRSIFVQVARAIHHLHTKAMIVHRDIKDENIILDGEGNIKLIDFGSAAYLKSGPFDVFVGTIDYAAPEVLAGRPYGGKEQDVWALGILLYTIVYKENPFYSIDEIMDHDLRVPYVMSEASIDLIRCMLDRDVASRIKIEDVLRHEWSTTIDEADDESIDTQTGK